VKFGNSFPEGVSLRNFGKSRVGGARFEGGYLTIKAKEESFAGFDSTSAANPSGSSAPFSTGGSFFANTWSSSDSVLSGGDCP
jgi:hypothetical protein